MYPVSLFASIFPYSKQKSTHTHTNTHAVSVRSVLYWKKTSCQYKQLFRCSARTVTPTVASLQQFSCQRAPCRSALLILNLGPRQRWAVNPLTHKDPYRGRTAPLTSKRCILYTYSTNLGTEYFKHGIYSPLFSSSKCSLFHNSNVFCSCIIHILYTGCAKINKYNSGAKRLMIYEVDIKCICW